MAANPEGSTLSLIFPRHQQDRNPNNKIFERVYQPQLKERKTVSYLESQLTLPLKIATVFGFGKVNRHGRLYNLYSFLVGCFTLYMVGRFVSLIEWKKGFDVIAVQIAGLSWTCQVLCSAITIAYNQRSDNSHFLWRQADEFCLDKLIRDAGGEKTLKRFVYGLKIFWLVFGTGFFAFNILPYVGVIPNLISGSIFFYAPADYVMIVLAFLCLFLLFSQQFVYIVTCHYVSTSWHSFAAVCRKKRFEHVPMDDLVEWGLEKHWHLLEITRHANNMFGVYTVIEVALCVPALIMEMYSLYLNYDPLTKTAIILWTVGTVMQITVICYASVIHSASLVANQGFYAVYVSFAKEKACGRNHVHVLQKADTLLASLRSGEGSMTACDMVTLDRAFLLTMISVIFNYLFLLVQFAVQPDDCASRAGNNNASMLS